METLQRRLKVLAVTTALLGGVSLFAMGGYGNCDKQKSCDGQGYNKECKIKDKKECDRQGYGKECKIKDKKECFGKKHFKHGKKHRMHHKGGDSRFIIGAVYSLDLTKEQQESIDKLVKKFQENKAKRYDAFTKEGFNKEAFIKSRMNMREDMIKAKADLLENIYKELTKEQKSELKEEIDDFQEIRRKNYSKECRGRR